MNKRKLYTGITLLDYVKSVQNQERCVINILC